MTSDSGATAEATTKHDASLSAVLDRLHASVAYWPRTWRLIWEAAPRQTLAWAILLAVQGILPVALVYLTKLLVDDLAGVARGSRELSHLAPTAILVALAGAVMLATQVLQSVSIWIQTAQSELIQDRIKGLIHQRAATVDMAFYDSPAYYDRLERARSEAASRPLMLLQSAGGLVQNGISLVAMAAIIIPYGWWLPLVLFISTAPALVVVLRFDQQYHHWWQGTTVDRRRAQYYDALLTDRVVAPEVRLFGLGSPFQERYQQLRTRLRTERLEIMRQQSLAGIGAGGASLLITGITMAWMVWRALRGLLTLGDLTLLYQAFTSGQGLARTLLANVGQVYESTLFLGNLFSFLDLEPQILEAAEPLPAPDVLQHGIQFEDITFRYPGNTRAVLEHFDLVVPAGSIVAIVGMNGAGKTTLLKLLSRFYDPEAGRITLDGVDLRDLRLADLWRRVTVLLQYPIAYITTVEENIALGDLSTAPTEASISAAARSAGALDFIARLPDGYSTHLGRQLDGDSELSGGEWQRLAMARAYFRQAPVILLDEPTSFMDSWAETDWFERFRALAQGRTALMITHRFTIAMRADIIHVMDEGRIVESGSHDELLAQGGRYAQSWHEQMRVSNEATEDRAPAFAE